MKPHNQLRPVQVNDLTHINNVKKLSIQDNKCLEELREVLEKNNCLSKFGITLLHKHFDLNPDELLVESCDEKNRVLTSKPMKFDEVDKDKLIETVWRFDGVAGMECERFCPTGKNGSHYGYPDHY